MLALTAVQGFAEGVMEVGKYAGRKVSEVKGLMKDEIISSGEALAYSEPERVGGDGQRQRGRFW